jgi:hypothetical protein
VSGIKNRPRGEFNPLLPSHIGRECFVFHVDFSNTPYKQVGHTAQRASLSIHLPLATNTLSISDPLHGASPQRKQWRQCRGHVSARLSTHFQNTPTYNPSTNPFITKVAMSPTSKRSAGMNDDGMSALREGLSRMDVASRTSGGDIGVVAPNKETTSSRDVCLLQPSCRP